MIPESLYDLSIRLHKTNKFLKKMGIPRDVIAWIRLYGDFSIPNHVIGMILVFLGDAVLFVRQ